jgi:hypothetical protein
MRTLALAFLLAACAPKVHPEMSPFDEDDPRAGEPVKEKRPTWDELPIAPPATPGAREGTIERAALIATLDAGPGKLLEQFEVTAELEGERFVGWRLVAVDPGVHTFDGIDLVPGDVLVAINGRSIARPDELQAVWDQLRTAPEIVADVKRGDGKLQLRWTVTGG